MVSSTVRMSLKEVESLPGAQRTGRDSNLALPYIVMSLVFLSAWLFMNTPFWALSWGVGGNNKGAACYTSTLPRPWCGQPLGSACC